MAIARFPTIVLDCADPAEMSRFYGALLDWKIEERPDWTEIRADYGDCISFQQVKDYTAPAVAGPGGAAADAPRRGRRRPGRR